jgi:hypothetical protein
MPATGDEKLQGVRGAWRHSKVGRGREISTVWTNRGVQVGQSCSSRREVAGRAVRVDEAVGVSAGQSVDASAIGEGLDDDGLAAVGAPNSVSTMISNFVFDTPRSASWSPLRVRCATGAWTGWSRPGGFCTPLEWDGSSRSWGFRHGQQQLPLAGDM